jgi:predicted ATP-binding protein involved in virulence
VHPSWQARIIPSLRRTFPNLQLVVTTHSPIVLSYVDSDSVRLVKDFRLVERVPMTRGRDPNAVLTDVFEQALRPKDVDDGLRRVADLIDDNDIAQARQELTALRERLGSDDRDIVRLSAMIDLMAD